MALYSGSLSPLQTGEQCLLHVEASHHPHVWKGHMSPALLLLGVARFLQHRRHWPFFVAFWGQLPDVKPNHCTHWRKEHGGEAWPLAPLAGPVGELSTVPSVKRDFTPEGGPPPASGKSHLCQLCLQSTAKCYALHRRGSWRKRWTSHYDFGHNLLKPKQEVDSPAHFCLCLFFEAASGFSCVTWASLWLRCMVLATPWHVGS